MFHWISLELFLFFDFSHFLHVLGPFVAVLCLGGLFLVLFLNCFLFELSVVCPQPDSIRSIENQIKLSSLLPQTLPRRSYVGDPN